MRRIQFKKTRSSGGYHVHSAWGAYDSEQNWNTIGGITGCSACGYDAVTFDPDITTRHTFKFTARRAIRQRANLPQWTPDPPDELDSQW